MAVAIAVVWGAAGFPASPAEAADLDEVQRLFRTGRYDECAAEAAREVAKGWRGDDWYVLKIRSELARGRYAEAGASLTEARKRYPASLTLDLLGREVRRYDARAGDGAEASSTLIERIVVNAPERYDSPDGRVALGRYFLLRGADPKKVLDRFYDPVMKQQPDFAEAFYAAAELALDKQDYSLAADTLRAAPKDAAEDPGFHLLKARALAEGDHAGSAAALAEALRINPRYVDGLLLKADGLVDGERYAEAAEALDRIDEVNPREPRAWAYRAVLAHLRGDHDGEESARRSALAPWAGNPEVDTLIGRKLAQKYRFAEGEASLRKALALDPQYPPARVQLAETLLRLGKETEGWKLVDEIFAADGYNVVAFNLTTLRDRLSKFRTLEADGLVVRMDPREADLYGDRVLALLKEARSTLGARYGAMPPTPLIVEIFPQKQQFAVRTFGLPGADGLLGVCFGPVITAISPASQGEHPSNWEAVLWHELCHAVTLTKTRNTMPRWLSEGISVYEEGLKNRAWATQTTPALRQALLGEKLTPLSRLSSAFLEAKTGQDLQFAYFESALAVEFLVEKAGFPALSQVLDDLGAGKNLDAALPSRTGTTLDQLDGEFAAFAKRKAEAVAPGATWEEVDLPAEADSAALTAWIAKHPTSHPGWRRLATRLVAEGKWPEAKAALLKYQALYPDYVGAENAYMLLAEVDKRLGDVPAERAVLEDLAARDGDATPAQARLIELDEAAGDWEGVAANSRRLLAVNPLIPAPHRALARAAEKLGRRDEAIAAYRSVALLDDTDPAQVHQSLAKLLREAGRPADARREVLKALEEAPRFLDAHRLLLEIVDADSSKPPETPRPKAEDAP
ncbi:tetratricopeptide repeat protein [Paludisphaera mucosa]|uniref:Tetratricopeptide repeat protein n=1 Tax=Paludisphaera mucosa TaxID=3030827 RepID=A0ABT6F9T6_9BACT|nr:tetratricopeptide repeat protein [Paludisphaera mucosa]MDG3004353.1 tetratricopeptide repeat protein [Paludisphaera mucosa]